MARLFAGHLSKPVQIAERCAAPTSDSELTHFSSFSGYLFGKSPFLDEQSPLAEESPKNAMV